MFVCYSLAMLVREWAEAEGLNVQTVWKWCRNNTMPVPFEKTPTGTYLIHDPKYENYVTDIVDRVVCYARVSSSDQRKDLDRQADRLHAFAIAMGVDNPEIVKEIGSGMNENRKRLNKILSDLSITTIIVEHRDRLARMNAGLIESALTAAGRRLIVIDKSELDDDLVRDMTEVLTSFCARLYGRRGAKQRAQRKLLAEMQNE